MDVEEFKLLLQKQTDAELVTEVLLAPGAKHVKDEDIQHIRRRLAEVFDIDVNGVEVYVVGSAKLGFSISEKREKGVFLPMFRPFRPESDIDIAVISPPIFNAIWAELSRHANSSAFRMPWDSGQLGDYLVHGWLRPDHFPFPRTRLLRRCDLWWDQFGRFSRDERFGRRKVRGGLYHTVADLTQYQQRGVTRCRKRLELTS